MAIVKRKELNHVLIAFDKSGKSPRGAFVNYDVGAWDNVANEWVAPPEQRQQPLKLQGQGADVLQTVLGEALTAALAHNAELQARVAQLEDQIVQFEARSETTGG